MTPGGASLHGRRRHLDAAKNEVTRADRIRAKQRQDIQILRAVAVGGVVLYHGSLLGLRGGYAGVDVFFVISGFLVGGHLVREVIDTGRVRVWRFWGRRIRRLLPAATVVTVASLAAARLAAAPLLLTKVAQDSLGATFEVANIVFARSGVSYSANQSPSLFQHFWSLSLEEQFYIALPLVILLITVLGRFTRAVPPSSTAILLVLLSLGAASFVLGAVATESVQPYAFYLLPTRAWEFALGTAVYLFSRRVRAPLPPAVRVVLCVMGWTAVFVSFFVLSDTTPFPGFAALLPSAGAAAVVAAAIQPGRRNPALSAFTSSAVAIGDWSYSIYLWHWPILVMPAFALAGPWGTGSRIVAVLAAVVIGAISYRWIESVFRVPRSRLPYPAARTLVICVSTSVVVAALCSSGITLSTTRTTAALAASITPARLAQATSAAAVVPMNLTPSLENAAEDGRRGYGDCLGDLRADTPTPCFGGDRSSPRQVVLYGDSHAAQWYPLLTQMGKSSGFGVVLIARSACPSANVPVFSGFFLRHDSECDRFRERALTLVARLRPTVILLSNALGYGGEVRAGEPLVPSPAFEAIWRRGLEWTIDRMSGSSIVGLIGPTPRFRYAPSACLSAHLRAAMRCTMPLNADTARRTRTEEAVAANQRLLWIDPLPYLCTRKGCPAMARNVLLYADSNHLTSTYVRRLEPCFRSLVARLHRS